MKKTYTVRALPAATLLVTLLLGTTTAMAGNDHKGHAHHSAPAKAQSSVTAKQTDWGVLGQASQVSRTIEIDMTDDMKFKPSSLQIKQGEVIRFKINNRGKMLHELVLGTTQENAKYAAKMLKNSEDHADEAYMVHVDPGQTGELVWNFNRPGTFEYACLIAGHYQAGMKGTLVVQAAARAAAPAAAQAAEYSQGEVRRVNADTGEVTLKHGPLKNLDMPPMTMVFKAQNPDALKALQKGDQVEFIATQKGSDYLVTDIRKKQ